MATVQVEIRMAAFDPWQELSVWGKHAAASAVFIGRVRATAMRSLLNVFSFWNHFSRTCGICSNMFC